MSRTASTSSSAGTIAAFAVAFAVAPHLAHTQASVTLPLDITGEVRVRSEYEHVPSAPADLFTYLRARLGVRVTPAPGIRVLVQMQDARVLGSEGIATASAADVLELHQGYLEIDRAWRQYPIALRAGRQEITIGNERLVGVSNWTNLGRSLDGFRLTLNADTSGRSAKPWSLTALAATVEERGHRFGAQSVDLHPTDHTLAGVSATREVKRNTTSLEALLLYDGSGKYRRYRNSDRGTAYARVRTGLPLKLRADIEAAVQVGHQQYAPTDTNTVTTSQDVSAWFTGARLATASLGTHKATLALGADVLSGDASPNDATYGAFSTMFASNHGFYGLQDVIGDPAASTHERGLIDMLATGGLAFNTNVSLRAEAHHFAMQAGTNASLANELDLQLPVRVGAAANIELGYSAFRALSGAPSQSLGLVHTTRHWAYLQLRAGF